MRKYAVLRTPRKDICAIFSLEIEGKILLMLTAAKLFFREQDEAQVKQERNKLMSFLQNKWDFILKKIALHPHPLWLSILWLISHLQHTHKPAYLEQPSCANLLLPVAIGSYLLVFL